VLRILPRPLDEQPDLKVKRPAPLSRRRVRTLLSIGQYWIRWEGDGVGWRVVQIHRRDGLVALERPGWPRRYVTFATLGADYELEP